MAIGSFLVMSAGVICANVAFLTMLANVNARLDDVRQISYFGMWSGKFLNVWRQYREFYPLGRLHVVCIVGLTIAVVGWMGIAMVIFGVV